LSFPLGSYPGEEMDEVRMTNADGRMNKILSKHFMDPADVVVKKDEPEAA
jgi:hypothetical protein